MNTLLRRQDQQRGRTWGQRFVLALNAAMFVTALTLSWVLHLTYQQVSAIDRIELGGTLSVAPSTKPGERVLNILLVGYDSSDGLDPDDPIQVGRDGERLGDVTIILHIDERAGTAAMLSIPRDLWVPIEGYGDRRINYAFGIEGPELLIETIDREFGIPIHHYMSVDFAGFQGIVEAVDHVDVYFEQPARDWNETEQQSQTGFEMLIPGCQPLDPPTALAYVRSRYYQVQQPDGEWTNSLPLSDIGRIQRQQDFMFQLMKRAIATGARNPFTLADLIDVTLEQITIDQEMTPQLLLDLGATYRSFDPGELGTYSYPSDSERVGTAWVLLPLKDQAEAVLELFRGSSADAPSTVYLTIEADPGQKDLLQHLTESLEQDGFSIDGTQIRQHEGGIVLAHGPDGQQAAELVQSSLRRSGVQESVTLKLVAGDPVFNLAYQGRSVVMILGPDAGASPGLTNEPADSDEDKSSSQDPPPNDKPEFDSDADEVPEQVQCG